MTAPLKSGVVLKKRNTRLAYEETSQRIKPLAHSSLMTLILIGASLLPSTSAVAAKPSKPNIVFILVDDLGWADIACFGSKFYETPNIDVLAKSGVKMTSAYAACPVCSPTRGSIMTGKYPFRVGSPRWGTFPKAEEAAAILALADLRGIDSHGIARLHAYATMLECGRINPTPELRIVRETPGTATVDGDNGLGRVVGPWANRLSMDKAEAVGTGWVAVRGSNHFGIAGYYVIEALDRVI